MSIEQHALRTFRARLRSLEREIFLSLSSQSECCGVTPAQCHLLLEIDMNPGFSLIDLSASLSLDPSTLSRTAESLRKKGFLACPRDDADRRLIRPALTEPGKKAVDDINRYCDEHYRGLLSSLDAEDLASVLRGTERLSVMLKNSRTVCCDPDAQKRAARVEG